MVTRYTINKTGEAAYDAGRVNSERTIERGSNKKWLDGMKTGSDTEADEAMRNLK